MCGFGGQQCPSSAFSLPACFALCAAVLGPCLVLSRQVADLVGLFLAAGLRGDCPADAFSFQFLRKKVLVVSAAGDFAGVFFGAVVFLGRACREASGHDASRPHQRTTHALDLTTPAAESSKSNKQKQQQRYCVDTFTLALRPMWGCHRLLRRRELSPGLPRDRREY